MKRTLYRCSFLILLTAYMNVPTTLGQNKRGPSTPEERTMAVKFARSLEAEPFGKDAKKMREWFTLWLIQVPDITVAACADYFGPVVGSTYKYDSEIFTQMLFSSAAFIIEHPDEAKNQLSVNLAGLEGALTTYEAMIKAQPKARQEYMEGLLTKRNEGELRNYVDQIAKTKCRGKE